MRWPGGKRVTLIDWLCLCVCFALCCVLLYRGLVKTFTAEGIPEFATTFYGWQLRHMPQWWFDFLGGLSRVLG